MPLIIKPVLGKGLTGVITIPGDKSMSHRAVLLAAIAEGDSIISGWLPAGDTWATIQAVRALGVPVEILSESETSIDLLVRGVGMRGLQQPSAALNCQGSGTTMRLLAGIVAGQSLDVTLDGHDGLRRRPMERVARPLRQLGASVETSDGRPPIRIRGGNLTGIDYVMPIASAQVKSAALLGALFADGPSVIHQPGPARDHTERMLRAQGVAMQADGNSITIQPPTAPLTPLNFNVPGDFSSAVFPLVAALLIPGSKLKLENVNTNITRTGLLDVLQAMQANISLENERTISGEPCADLLVESRPLQATEIQGEVVVRMIDEFPILAVAATQAKGRTIVRDAEELRVKESDRIKATVNELRKLGAQIIPHPDGFEVYGPTPLKGATVNSNGDHRLAMAMAVAGLIAQGETKIQDADVIADSYPGFASMLNAIGAEASQS